MDDGIGGQDQLAAAAAHAALHEQAFRKAPEVGRVSNVETPKWFVAGIERHNKLITDGLAVCCMHLEERPIQPTVAALWAPGMIACGKCAASMLSESGAADRTCDGCGRYFAQGLKPLMLTDDHHVMHASACAECVGMTG